MNDTLNNSSSVHDRLYMSALSGWRDFKGSEACAIYTGSWRVMAEDTVKELGATCEGWDTKLKDNSLSMDLMQSLQRSNRSPFGTLHFVKTVNNNCYLSNIVGV